MVTLSCKQQDSGGKIVVTSKKQLRTIRTDPLVAINEVFSFEPAVNVVST